MTPDEFQYEYNYEDYLHEATMGTPLIIVEGENDIIYEKIADSVNKNHYDISPIKNLIGKEGNLALEKFILELESYAKEEALEYTPYILGIIDRDYREYEKDEYEKNRLTQSKILYILEFYSIESYFVNKEVIKHILLYGIKSERLVNDKLIDKIYQKITDELMESLYFESLIKLQEHLKSTKSLSQLETEFNLNKSFETLLKITKGKILLRDFLNKWIYYNQEERKKKTKIVLKEPLLYEWCESAKITPCKNHKNKDHKNFCLYQVIHYRLYQLKNNLFKNTNITSLTPIKERLKQLK